MYAKNVSQKTADIFYFYYFYYILIPAALRANRCNYRHFCVYIILSLSRNKTFHYCCQLLFELTKALRIKVRAKLKVFAKLSSESGLFEHTAAITLEVRAKLKAFLEKRPFLIYYLHFYRKTLENFL